jgi:tight adherence protein C
MSAPEIVLIVVVAASLFAATWAAIAVRPRRRELLERLRQYQDVGYAVETHETRLQGSLWERFFNPMLERLGERIKFSSKASMVEQLDTQLELAGRPAGLSPAGLIALQFVAIAGGAAIGFLLGNFVLAVEPAQLVLLMVATAALGFYIPRIWVKRSIAERRLEIVEAMPNALDLLTLSVEAGLAFDGALVRVAEKYQNSLSDEFGLVIAEMKLGRSRKDAMSAMAERLGIEEMTSFVGAIVQSTELGTNLGETLRIQSVDMRRRRRQRAEEKGNQAPLKMLMPMVGCIFPSLFIVLLGPAAIQLVHQFGQH